MAMYERVMTEKGNQIFGQEESAPPPRENPGYANALSLVACSNLVPDKPVHALMLSNQHIRGRPRLLYSATSPVITLFSILS